MDDSKRLLISTKTLLDEEPPLNEAQASLEQQFEFRSRCESLGHYIRRKVDEKATRIKQESGTGDEIEEQELRSGIATVIDLTEDEPSNEPKDGQESEKSRVPVRNAQIDEQDQLPDFQYGDDKLFLKPGVIVEIKQIKDLYHASFLRIQQIIQTPDGIILRGIPFVRTRQLRGQLSRFRNEVCMVLRIDEDDDRPDEIQAAIEVPVTDVVTIRKLHCTNADFPQNRFDNIYAPVEEIERDGNLTCRWKYRLLFKSAAARKGRQPPCQYILSHLRAEEASAAHTRVSDMARLNSWRGSIVRGGSYNKNTGQDIEAVEDLEEHFDADLPWIDKVPGQRYTLGDMFCGAGGVSLGAQQAGFHIRVACDLAVHACATHRNNFPQADLREEDIWKFIEEDLTWGGKSDHVDVLHLSPPCQFWSPAHTVPGVNDEANIAVLFSCHELIKKFKPRIFTLEQTFGILHPRFEYYFNALIRGFTQYSYSIRWKVVNLLEWGLPSRRTRLIMVGACPGETLPTFPRSTHASDPSPGSGLRPFVTVMDAFRRIPPDATMHEKRHRHWYKKPWDPSIPLARCITTHGGYGNYHYSGRRDFTLRELATMNGFPASYQFHRQNTKRQIGNAFPPCAVRVLYVHLLKWLEDADRVKPVEEEQTTLEDEHEYDVCESDVEDDVQIIRVDVKRRKSSGSDSTVENMDIDGPMLCIDPSQLDGSRRSSIIDLTTDLPVGPGGSIPIVAMDGEKLEDHGGDKETIIILDDDSEGGKL